MLESVWNTSLHRLVIVLLILLPSARYLRIHAVILVHLLFALQLEIGSICRGHLRYYMMLASGTRAFLTTAVRLAVSILFHYRVSVKEFTGHLG